jgi:hypothetical protein
MLPTQEKYTHFVIAKRLYLNCYTYNQMLTNVYSNWKQGINSWTTSIEAKCLIKEEAIPQFRPSVNKSFLNCKCVWILYLEAGLLKCFNL